MDDIITTIKAQLYERTVSPLLGSFAFYWLIFNYKLLLVIFSGMNAAEKIAYIDLMLLPDLKTILLRGFLCPLIAALIFIFLYPFIAKPIVGFTSTKQRDIRELKNSIDETNPMPREAVRKLRLKTARIKIEHESEIKRQEDVLASARAEFDQLLGDEQKKLYAREHEAKELGLEIETLHENLQKATNDHNALKNETQKLIDAVIYQSLQSFITENNLLEDMWGALKVADGKIAIEAKTAMGLGSKYPYYADYSYELGEFDIQKFKKEILAWAAAAPKRP